MDAAKARSNARSILGLSAVSLAIAAIIVFAPRSPEPERGWQPPAGFTIADTTSLGGNQTLRLWTGPSGWYVESVTSGRHEAAVAAAGGGDQYSVSEVLNGLVGNVPVPGTQAVSVRSQGTAVRANVHAGLFLAPAAVVAPTDVAVLVTPLDANGTALAGETLVPIAGRT
ncbi:hypothetical protein [Micromonospora rhizosphaerae]|uniref:hypothetical protein n=1 Tax=Micromonospora rhizosphaerae TaxID=568872 RepID=UPI00114CB4FD|nr:hypothetical protein [Micromonospora rhizosphaerae]